MAGTTIAASVPPRVSTTLSIEPSTFHPGNGNSQEPPIITLTVTSHAEQPITLFTWPTIFNLELSQRRSNFSCRDLMTDQTLHLELTKGPKRPAFSRESRGRDDAHFHLLEPNKPVSFAAPFKLANRASEGNHALIPGHRYRFAVSEGENVPWWHYGTKASVMAPAGERAELGDPSGPPLKLIGIPPVEFQVLEP